MKPTRPFALVAVAVLVAAVSWGVLRVYESRMGELPGVPLSAPLALGFLAAVLGFSALNLRSRLRAQRQRLPGARHVDPLRAARYVVLAKASSVVAALMVGWYAGFGVVLLGDLESDYRRERLLLCGACVVAGVLAVLAAMALERVCRLPDDEDENQNPPAIPAA